MVNDINASELTDEQLEAVVGGSKYFGAQNAFNDLLQLNIAVAPTVNVNVLSGDGNIYQSGAKILQGNLAGQSASNA